MADLSLISRRIHNEHLSDPFVFRSASGRPLLDHIVGDIKKPLYVLLEATCCLLLIACLNVANLLVARAAARRKELAIRTALGGGWLRLMRERLMESLLLSAAGGVLGLLLAAAALAWLKHTRTDMSRIESIHIDGVVAAFTVGIIVLCALFSGLIAAFSAVASACCSALHEASRSVSGGRARAALRKGLLAIEVGLTVVLLIGAGLLLKSYDRLRSADMGCITENVLTMHLGLPDARYATPAQRANFFDTLLERVRALPGVDAAGFVTVAPGQGYWGDWGFTIVEHPPLPQGGGHERHQATGRIQSISSRWVFLSCAAAHSTLANDWMRPMKSSSTSRSPISTFPARTQSANTSMPRFDISTAEIVGIVGDTRSVIGEKPLPMMYFPLNAGVETVGTLRHSLQP